MPFIHSIDIYKLNILLSNSSYCKWYNTHNKGHKIEAASCVIFIQSEYHYSPSHCDIQNKIYVKKGQNNWHKNAIQFCQGNEPQKWYQT